MYFCIQLSLLKQSLNKFSKNFNSIKLSCQILKCLTFSQNTDCLLESDKFKVVSKSSHYNDKGAVFCKKGHMFYEVSFIPNITALCDKNAKWSFNSINLHCHEGLI